MNFKIPALVTLIISIYQCSDKIRIARLSNLWYLICYSCFN